MTRGIKVIWPNQNDANANTTDEVEFLHGIDVERLDRVPPITTVPALWPQREGGPLVDFVEYNVQTRHERRNAGEVRLFVRYDKAANEHLVRQYGDDIGWGTNIIILRQGEQNGTCQWRHEDATDSYDVPWTTFDMGASQGRPRARYSGSRREALFRNMILNCDRSRCVLTGEATVQALEAAHLVPARMGENDMPFNGIALRADLHRLFDAGLFTFNPDGKVKFPDGDPGSSAAYVGLLHDARLPKATLRRVKQTLASPEFQNRCHCAVMRLARKLTGRGEAGRRDQERQSAFVTRRNWPWETSFRRHVTSRARPWAAPAGGPRACRA